MLEYFSWKKIKANRDATTAKEAETSKSAVGTASPAATALGKPVPQSKNLEGPQPVLSHHDEAFLREQLENTDEPPIVIFEGDSGSTTPRLSSTLPTPGTETPPTNSGLKDVEEGKGKDKGKGDWTSGIKSRFGDLRRTVSSATDKKKIKPKSSSPSKEEKGKGKEIQVEEDGKEKGKRKEERSEERQADELTAALEGLNLAAENGRAFSITPATKELLDKFILILKDLANGVPTAYQDLVDLFDSSSKTLEDTFQSLPSFLQKIIKALPKKMQANLSPEILRTAATVSPMAAAEFDALGGALPTLKELVTKPGLVMGLLKSVVNLLKTRFPAMLGGANLALSMALFVVLYALWYCYKRGREVRLEAEAAAIAAELVGGAEGGVIEGSADVPEVVVGSTRVEGKRKDI